MKLNNLLILCIGLFILNISHLCFAEFVSISVSESENAIGVRNTFTRIDQANQDLTYNNRVVLFADKSKKDKPTFSYATTPEGIKVLRDNISKYQNFTDAEIVNDLKLKMVWVVKKVRPALVSPPKDSYGALKTNTLSYYRMANGYKDFKVKLKDRPATIYMALNDGMLHAFDQLSLKERWAFLPDLLDAKMVAPKVQDIYIGGAWRSVLVCGGSSGYFALDVTDPKVPRHLYTYTNVNDIDKLDSEPVFVLLPGGTWAWIGVSGKRLIFRDAFTGEAKPSNISDVSLDLVPQSSLTQIYPDMLPNGVLNKTVPYDPIKSYDSIVGLRIYYTTEDPASHKKRLSRLTLVKTPQGNYNPLVDVVGNSSDIGASIVGGKVLVVNYANTRFDPGRDELALFYEDGDRIVSLKDTQFEANPINLITQSYQCATQDLNGWYLRLKDIPDSSANFLGDGWKVFNEPIIFKKKIYIEILKSEVLRLVVIDLCGKAIVSKSEYKLIENGFTNDVPIYYYGGQLYKRIGGVSHPLINYFSDLKDITYGPQSNLKYKTRAH